MSKEIAFFNRFSLELPLECVEACSHSGSCDEDVEYWAPRIQRPKEITKKKLAEEMEEYGAWDCVECEDDEANWKRLIWIAAGNIQENLREERMKS